MTDFAESHMTPEQAHASCLTNESPETGIDGWSVTVRINGENVLTIEHDCVSSVEITDGIAAAVRNAAVHLLSFVGAEDESDEDQSAEHMAAQRAAKEPQ